MLDTRGQMIRKGLPDMRDAYVEPELTNLSVGFLQAESDFVASAFCPHVPVDQVSGKFPNFPRGWWYRDDMEKRADGAVSAGGGYGITYLDFLCEVWAWHTKVGPQLRANTRTIDLDRQAAALCAQKALLNREVQFMSTFFKDGVWTTQYTGADTTPDAADEVLTWKDTDAQPIDQLDAAIHAQIKLVGPSYRPNKMLIGDELWRTMKNHPNVINRVNSGQTPGGPAQVTLANIAALLELDEVRVARVIKTTSAETPTEAASTYDFISEQDSLLLAHVPSSPGVLTPSAMYQFDWTGYSPAGARMRRWQDVPTMADFYEIEQAYDMKVVAADLCVWFHDMLTTPA